MTLKNIILPFKWQFSLTLFLVLTESALEVLFPLFIGLAIDDVLQNEYSWVIYLGLLGVASILIGGGRRFYDSRFYAKVYQKVGLEMTTQSKITTSKKTARLSMLGEVVEFFENSIPSIVISLIGLIGTLIIVVALNLKIFIGCVVVLLMVFLVYWLTSKKTIRFNAEYNNELERQVDVVTKNEVPSLKNHLRNLMKWNIKLSDLETINFSVAWMLMMGFLVLSIIWAVDNDDPQYGKVFALVMYVFQYIESVIVLPLFYQQWLRLQEITERLSKIDEE